MSVIVVIPAYNEGEKIHEVARQVVARGFRVVVVDDGSSDATAAEASRAGCVVLRHAINRGYGAALTTGSQWALSQDCDVVVHFDADGQHDASEIREVVEPILTGEAEATIGSRFLGSSPSLPPLRRLLIRSAVIFTRIVSRVELTDAHNGFRAFSAAALARLDCFEDGMSYASEVVERIAAAGLRLREVPVSVRYSEYSVGKGEGNLAKVRIGMRYLWTKLTR